MRSLLKYGFLLIILLLLAQPLLAAEKKAANAVPAQNKEITKKTGTSCDWATIITLAKDVLTGAAIILGGIWTYMLFIRTRQKYPRANITHGLTVRVERCLGNVASDPNHHTGRGDYDGHEE